MSIESFRDLHVWQKSMDLIPGVYQVAHKLPGIERFALADQLRRACVSIASNIAEGSRRFTRTDFRHFCHIAKGSAAEVETQLLIAERLYKIDINNQLQLTIDIQKMLTALIRSLS